MTCPAWSPASLSPCWATGYHRWISRPEAIALGGEVILAQDLFYLSAGLNLEVVLLSQLCLTLRSHGLLPIRLLRPWNSPDKNIGMSSHSLLQEIIPNQGLNRFPALQADSLLSDPPGKPLERVGRGNCMLKAGCLRCGESMFQESVNTAGRGKYIVKPLRNIRSLHR